MECAELTALRQEATGVFKELAMRRRRAREYAAVSACGARIASALVRRSDFEAYLQRRLAKSTARIEGHVIAHGCQA
jgi:hypothetical protein